MVDPSSPPADTDARADANTNTASRASNGRSSLLASAHSAPPATLQHVADVAAAAATAAAVVAVGPSQLELSTAASKSQPRYGSDDASASQREYLAPPGPGPGADSTATTAAATTTIPTPTPITFPPSAPAHLGRPGQDVELPFVKPSSYLRRKPSVKSSRTMAEKSETPLNPLDREQLLGLRNIRKFLRVRTSYDVLPMSFRLIVLDTGLLIKKSLNIFIQNSIVSAPLWDSNKSAFAGLLTSTDYINVIQYYCQYPAEFHKLDQFRLSSLRDIEKAIGAAPLETVSCHPMRPLYEACQQMLKTRARRIPLIDRDDETGRETVVCVITQYRILKFIAVNNEHNTVLLKRPVGEIGLGTYNNLATARMADTVLSAVHTMVKKNISCIPVVDAQGHVLNVFEAVDIIPCIRGGAYEDLDKTIGEALCKRPDDSPGIYTCSPEDRLDSIFDTLRKSRVHRLIVVDDDSKLVGVISLSDILKYVLFHGHDEDEGGAEGK